MAVPIEIRLRPQAFAVSQTPGQIRRPLGLSVAMKLGPLAHRMIDVFLRLPAGGLRSRIVVWAFRDQVAASLAQRDFEAVRAFSAPDLEYIPPPELAVMLTEQARSVESLKGVEFAIRAMEIFLEAWGELSVVPEAVFDCQDGRFLILLRMNTMGRASGVALEGQEYAELYQLRGGVVVRMQQWLDWRSGLEAIGVAT